MVPKKVEERNQVGSKVEEHQARLQGITGSGWVVNLRWGKHKKNTKTRDKREGERSLST